MFSHIADRTETLSLNPPEFLLNIDIVFENEWHGKRPFLELFFKCAGEKFCSGSS
jgi:hypothetical protein